ncbi:gamma-butyrobetaine hydroxylase-like domain-containing protein [Ponticaulis sp.]|uniref:gamma-butyrobetaine hydroxylase-like domain-containing protein n=1 Tax=Ponticaulis sp. TaxID=2020902 RepID=UPI000B6C8470|nr:gamma-butyrobetaine hydroxylase-like domain-containing protein [Ponticaulis sp.]MAI90643.1 hypothetical protein [Ponticaulis sp.]OUX99155.1 MAG: hypothetical protein CBB65_09405 [Hyphomonadaceae bacterium TMED5]|tara:strand:+ start:58844 stop:59188 length:345 start_codon:yes stop_codon:yes gene_type:complete
MPHPTRLRFRSDEKCLTVEYDDASSHDIPYELLRVESPSAEVQGHAGQKPPPVMGKADIGVNRAEPVGRYAVRIIFDDGHDSGLFTWPLLQDFGARKDELYAAYQARVAEFQGK